ncbi:protein SUPPRESSOR OF npr1-1, CONSTITUTIVE 1-like [Dorcoceras hygrometricum]|uniref:Protein SUPPRESSOR OF npr1-1, CONSTITUTIVE 1-like n=1 Tax=Dorcoceras hygrometricum TaxID=472368 RepID=A0A2Z7C0J3_9LAMI|nr:protein SUPPRESSOR OF npr1-1, CONSTITUTIVE 1-like [Dorcoceras hygrometricum]
MSLFDLQDVCIVIGSLATLDLPMVVDLIGIYGLKGPYSTLTTTDWFLQALSVIPRGSWGDVARRFTMIRWFDVENPIVLISSGLLVQSDEGVSDLVVDRIDNDQKVLVSEESNSKWADSNSETTSSSSSSESEKEEVHCLMVNQTTDDEVFDFSNSEFRREYLITVLNEMVHEYRKLYQTLEEINAENGGLKNSSVEPSTAQLGETDSLQTELSKLKIENDSVRTKSCELSSKNGRLNQVMSSWTQSSISLSKLHETQKPLNDKTGLGFSFVESSSEETCTQSDLVDDKFKKMNFVKASVIHDVYESVKYDDKITQLSQKGSRTPQNPPQVLNTLRSVSVRESRIQYLCDPQWFRDTASRGPTTIVAPESQFRTCPSDHDNIGYPRMSASGESSTTMHRLLHASGSHPIPPPNDPKTNQYNQDLRLIHSTNGNHLESPNEDSSIDHQVTIYLHAQNITMFRTNETWYFASQILVSSSGGLILILTAQSTRN